MDNIVCCNYFEALTIKNIWIMLFRPLYMWVDEIVKHFKETQKNENVLRHIFFCNIHLEANTVCGWEMVAVGGQEWEEGRLKVKNSAGCNSGFITSECDL